MTEGAVSISAGLDDELRLLRASAREFVAREIAPHMDDWERVGELPRSLHEKAGNAGFLGVGFPEEAGGSGGTILHTIVIVEEIILYPKPTYLMTAEGREQAVALRPWMRERTNRFEPAREAAATFAGASPPAASWSGDHDRREARIRSGEDRCNVGCLRRGAVGFCHEGNLRACLRLLVQPSGFGARDLKRRRAERLRESRCVEEKKARTAASRDQDHGFVGALPHFSQHSATAFAPGIREPRRLRFGQADLRIAAQRSEASTDATFIGKARIKQRHAVYTAIPGAHMTCARVNAAQVEGFEHRLNARFPRLVREPIRRSDISLRRRAMVSLTVVGLDNCGNALLDG